MFKDLSDKAGATVPTAGVDGGGGDGAAAEDACLGETEDGLRSFDLSGVCGTARDGEVRHGRGSE